MLLGRTRKLGNGQTTLAGWVHRPVSPQAGVQDPDSKTLSPGWRKGQQEAVRGTQWRVAGLGISPAHATFLSAPVS